VKTICGHMKSGHLVKMTVEYHCKSCKVSVMIPFWGNMTDEQLNFSKRLTESLLCKTCYVDEKIPEFVECLIN